VTDVGDLLTPTLTVSPFDATTAASLSITAPGGTVTAGTGEATADGGATWTANPVTLNAAGMWVFAWTVTGTGQGVEYSTVIVNLAPTSVAFAPALAGLSDLILRAGELTAAQAARASAYLTDASALIRAYTRQTFTVVSNDTVILRPVGSFLLLTQLPVTAVDSVAGVHENGVVGDPLGGWVFDGIDKIDITTVGFGWLADPWWPWPYGPESFQVVYDHGSATVPADVVAVCCAMVLRTLLSPTLVEGMTSERIGQYSYQLGQFSGGASVGATVRLSEQDKDALSNYRVKAGSIQVRI
jgi:hypothetical protein